jgi:hypothetical protein
VQNPCLLGISSWQVHHAEAEDRGAAVWIAKPGTQVQQGFEMRLGIIQLVLGDGQPAELRARGHLNGLARRTTRCAGLIEERPCMGRSPVSASAAASS